MSAAPKLRPVTWNDLDPIHELLSNWDVVRYMLFPLCSREETERFLHETIDEPVVAAWQSSVRAIAGPSSDLVGLCGIAILRGSEEGEIWYLVNPACQGQGLATAAVAELIELGFKELHLHRIWASCLPGNPASVRVLEKLGLRREGLRIRNLKIHGEWRDSYLYAILAEEWPGLT
jgi:RimJ/RimL family protein N-acetyltransferase